MLSINKFENIYLCRPFIDFRRGINGLSSIVQDQMNLNPFENYLFLFCNTKRDKIKALYWDKTGFAMWYKRLENEKYKWPSHLECDQIVVNKKELNRFLIGLNPWELPHQQLNYKKV